MPSFCSPDAPVCFNVSITFSLRAFKIRFGTICFSFTTISRNKEIPSILINAPGTPCPVQSAAVIMV